MTLCVSLAIEMNLLAYTLPLNKIIKINYGYCCRCSNLLYLCRINFFNYSNEQRNSKIFQ